MLTQGTAGIRPTSKKNGPIIVARCLGIQVTPVVTAIHFLFLSWLQIMEYVPFIARKENYYFCGYTCRWILKLHHYITTKLVSLFYSTESYFVTIHRSDEYFYYILQL